MAAFLEKSILKAAGSRYSSCIGESNEKDCNGEGYIGEAIGCGIE